MIRLRRTCFACPEQYDALDESGAFVGYLRLRHGSFTVTCPHVDGTLVYSASAIGDGIFEDDERDKYLRFAVDAIEKWVAGEGETSPPDVKYEIVY